MCLFQHNGKQNRTHARTSMVKIVLRKLFAGILCGCVVLLVLVAKWVRGKKPSKPIHIRTALFTTRIHKENKQVLPYQPTSGKLWPTQSTVCVSFSMLENRREIYARTSMVKIALRKLFAGILCGCVVLLVLVAKWVREKNPSKPIHILTALFTTRVHKENKQVLPYQPTLLKTLANIICCMCLFQHVGKQNRTHARTSMVKIALRKLFAGILCGCVVLLVLVAKWVMEKNNPNTIHIRTALFHLPEFTKKTKKFYRTNQPRENFDQHNLLYVSLSACWKTGQNPCKNKHGENCIAQVVF